ncbi:hypothetical protein CYMTET_29742 [Cymbomonas tetramitiformis]|uniref:Uncharacterized protein n=1 Tax=Cymbomonas tetramitiformis TaxID=36881 RepID=A0AAE0KUM7_9CHLO|nr:hypothetical protein CYMTET_29742 [Cymbomonas tetramitiformis]
MADFEPSYEQTFSAYTAMADFEPNRSEVLVLLTAAPTCQSVMRAFWQMVLRAPRHRRWDGGVDTRPDAIPPRRARRHPMRQGFFWPMPVFLPPALGLDHAPPSPDYSPGVSAV